MAISLEQAVELTKTGQNFDITLIDFNVNTFHSDTEYDFHDSSNYENELSTTTSKTLLHIAIESGNVKIFNALLDNGADARLDIEIAKNRRQRSLQSGSAFFGGAEWSDWQEWEPRFSAITTRDLAERSGNQEIIQRLNVILSSRLHM